MGKNKPGSTSPSGLPAANCRFAIDTTSWSAHAAYHSRVTVTQVHNTGEPAAGSAAGVVHTRQAGG